MGQSTAATGQSGMAVISGVAVTPVGMDMGRDMGTVGIMAAATVIVEGVEGKAGLVRTEYGVEDPRPRADGPDT